MPRTEQELEKAAGHVVYEWRMMQGAAQSDWPLPAAPGSAQKVINSNAQVELVLLHSRLLYDFLFTPSDDSDDIQAVHFLEGKAAKQWERQQKLLTTTLCPILKKDRRRLNKQLFHLSYKRKTPAQPWALGKILTELHKALQYFKSELSQNRAKFFGGM